MNATGPTLAHRLSQHRLQILLATLALLVLPLPILGRTLVGSEALAPVGQLSHFAPWNSEAVQPPPWDVLYWDDYAQILPWQAEAAEQVRAGHVPLWNDRAAGGSALLANSQTSALSPLWLCFQYAGILRAQGWIAYLQLVIAGLGTLALLLEWRLNLLSALSGAVVYELSGWSLSWTEFPNRHGPVAWLPLCLWLSERAFTRRGAWIPLAAGALGASILSSHIQFEFYLMLAIAGYSLWRMFPGNNPGAAPRGTAKGVSPTIPLTGLLIIFAGCLFAGMQLLPSAELGRQSFRVVGTSWILFQQRMSFAMPSWWLAQAFVPGIFGFPSDGTVPGIVLPGRPPALIYSGDFYEFGVFCGSAPLLLAVSALRQLRRRPLVVFFLLLALFSLLMAVGSLLNAPFYFLIPGFGAIAGTARMLYLWSLSIAGLSACAIDEFLAEDGSGLPGGSRAAVTDLLAFLIVGAGAIAAALTMIGAHSTTPGAGNPAQFCFAHLGELTALLVLSTSATLPRLTLVRRRLRKWLPAAALLLLTLTVVQLEWFGARVVRTGPYRDAFPASPAIQAIRDLHPFRLLQVGASWTLGPELQPPPEALTDTPAIPPNLPGYFGIQDLSSYDSLNSRRYMAYMTRLNGTGKAPIPQENGNLVLVSRPGSPLVAAAGVDLIVSARSLASNNLEFVRQAGKLFLYRVKRPDPPAFMVGSKGTIDERRPLSAAMRWFPGRIELTGLRGPGRIVVLDANAPGWQARVDGRRAAIRMWNGLFKSVEISRSARTVTMSYSPLSYRLGVYGSAMMFAWFAAAATDRLRSMQRRRFTPERD